MQMGGELIVQEEIIETVLPVRVASESSSNSAAIISVLVAGLGALSLEAHIYCNGASLFMAR
jgi:hypothetical protein